MSGPGPGLAPLFEGFLDPGLDLRPFLALDPSRFQFGGRRSPLIGSIGIGSTLAAMAVGENTLSVMGGARTAPKP